VPVGHQQMAQVIEFKRIQKAKLIYKCPNLLELNRNHWAIENRLHWVRDTVLKEDATKSR
jgi:hypothetical protein